VLGTALGLVALARWQGWLDGCWLWDVPELRETFGQIHIGLRPLLLGWAMAVLLGGVLGREWIRPWLPLLLSVLIASLHAVYIHGRLMSEPGVPVGVRQGLPLVAGGILGGYLALVALAWLVHRLADLDGVLWIVAADILVDWTLHERRPGEFAIIAGLLCLPCALAWFRGGRTLRLTLGARTWPLELPLATAGLLPLGLALWLAVFPEILIRWAGASSLICCLVVPPLCAGLAVFFAVFCASLTLQPRRWPRGPSIDGAEPGEASLETLERVMLRQALTWGIILGLVGGLLTASRLLWGRPFLAELWVAASLTVLGGELLEARRWLHAGEDHEVARGRRLDAALLLPGALAQAGIPARIRHRAAWQLLGPFAPHPAYQVLVPGEHLEAARAIAAELEPVQTRRMAEPPAPTDPDAPGAS
jgi:hypothetical protein